MGLFDLSRFRNLAFERKQTPDHPMEDEESTRALLADLPAHDASAALAELTHWVSSMNISEGFSAGRRARVLMILDDTCRNFWRDLGESYLSPDGKANPDYKGNPGILRALFESATEFAEGYRLIIEDTGRLSPWVKDNGALLGLRRARWLARRLMLAHMLRLPEADPTWQQLHALYFTAEERQQSRTVLAVFPGDAFKSSIKQEYVRLLLLEMADLPALSARQIELAFRIVGRVASAAQFEKERPDGTVYVVFPSEAHQPVLLARAGELPPGVLYLDTGNCQPRLRALQERDATLDAGDADTAFGGNFTLGERRAMVQRLQEHWGPNPPARHARRLPASATARVLCGFAAASGVLPLFDQGSWNRQAAADANDHLRIQLDDEEQKAKHSEKHAATRQFTARLLDSSVGGMGIAVRSNNTRDVRLGQLLAIQVEKSSEWIIGVVRRITVQSEEWTLGVQLLTRRPKLLWFRRESGKQASPWDMERASGHEFLDHFQSGIVVRNDDDELARGQLILAPGVARTGSYLDVPLAEGMLRMLVIATNEATEDFHRITYEPQEKTAYQGRSTAATPGGKSANVKTQKLVVDPEGANTASQKLAVLRANQNAKTQKLTPTKK
jgi:hypothetical protein